MPDIIGTALAAGSFDIDASGCIWVCGWYITGAFTGEIRVHAADCRTGADDLRVRELPSGQYYLVVPSTTSSAMWGASNRTYIRSSMVRNPADGALIVVTVEGESIGDIGTFQTVRHYEARDYDTGFGASIETVKHPDWDKYDIAGAGDAAYDGTYVEAGTYGGKPYYSLDAGHHLYWETTPNPPSWTNPIWALSPAVGGPVGNVVYLSTIVTTDTPIKTRPNFKAWAYITSPPTPTVRGHDLSEPYLCADRSQLWMVGEEVAMVSGSPASHRGIKAYRRDAEGPWTATETDPFGAGVGTYRKASCAILPDGSILVAASDTNLEVPSIVFARSRDHGATWSLITGDDLIGEAIFYGAISADEAGTVWACGLDGASAITIHGADCRTGVGEDLYRKELATGQDYLDTSSGYSIYDSRYQVRRHPDGSLLGMVSDCSEGGGGAWNCRWWRCRDFDTGFVQVT